MRRPQKTEHQADQQWRTGLEDQLTDFEARSRVSGENTAMNGIAFQSRFFDRDNLNQAYIRVRNNKGAAGIDGMETTELLDYLKKNRNLFTSALIDGSYKPQPVRRVEIPKPNGGKRKLGIPTVIDRYVQQALAQVLTPVFEQVFSDNSFGFRPNRSAHDAINRVVEFYNQGFHTVIDLDLKAYFDTVNHDLLIKFIEQYVQDPWIIRLIRQFLTSGAMDGKLFMRSEEGTPQGGPLSPLLANIYLNELDKLLTARGHHFVRYADDCNIYLKSKRAGQRVLKSVTQFLERDLKLTVNQEKTIVGSPLRTKFLGFTLGVDANGARVRPSNQSKIRVKRELRLITKRNRGVSIQDMFKQIQQKMRGWLQYYGIGQMSAFIRTLDSWLRTRIRQYIWKQWKKLKTKITNLRRLGLSLNEAHIAGNTRKGYWRTAHSKTLKYTLTNEKLERLGLINLTKTLQQIQNA